MLNPLTRSVRCVGLSLALYSLSIQKTSVMSDLTLVNTISLFDTGKKTSVICVSFDTREHHLSVWHGQKTSVVVSDLTLGNTISLFDTGKKLVSLCQIWH